jgi:hypothetical protein
MGFCEADTGYYAAFLILDAKEGFHNEWTPGTWKLELKNLNRK